MKAAVLRGVLLLACLATAAAAQERPERSVRARTLYVHHCSGCHLPDGSGAPDKAIPSMRGMLGQFLQVPGGREFIAQVPGVMNSPLKDAEAAELMNWLLPYVSAATLPAGLAPYTADEMARLRHSRPADLMARRAELLRAMAAAGLAVP
ncbi:cytochrome c [Pseudorhodoferax sp.]|uniref:cytochrome c n=1 Tax=Pseudorhodoferax sp. TaxID=1993553 RepID=UPI002DD68AB5|nr:cytochrome c [Pseudorhodoferax sp.]